MKTTILNIVLLCLSHFVIVAQVRINSITKLNQNFATYRDLNWYKDTLFVSGTTGGGNGWQATLAKYSKEGTLLDVNFPVDTSNEFNMGYWDKGLIIEDSVIYHISIKTNNSENYLGTVLKLSHSNQVLKSADFESYYFPLDTFCRFRDIKKIEDGFVILEINRRIVSDIQSCLLVIDNDFNQKWRKCYGSNKIDIPNEVFPLSNGNYVVLSSSSNLDLGEYYGPGTGYDKAYIFEVDRTGNLLWEWRSPDKIEASYSGFLENDSTLIIASGHGSEECTGQQSNDLCFFRWSGGAYKFDLQKQQKIWESSLSGGPETSQFDNRYYDIIQSIEKDGYILCGSGFDIAYEGCAQIDTTIKCWSYPGVISKISNDGDSLWMRKYFGVTDIWESNFLYSATIAPDSGYSFVGEAFNPWPGSDQGQFGWLLMTDKYGCLVPGCQLISSTEDNQNQIQSTDLPFKIFPNPTKDLINLLITDVIQTESAIALLDQYGNEIDRWQKFEKGATYMIPVQNYSPGIYYLILIEKNRVTKTEKVVILN